MPLHKEVCYFRYDGLTYIDNEFTLKLRRKYTMKQNNIEELKEKIQSLNNENESLRKKIEANQDKINGLYIDVSNCEANDLIEYCKKHIIGKCCKFTKVEKLFTFKWFIIVKDYEEEYDGDELSIKIHADATILTLKNKTNEIATYMYDKDSSFYITSSDEDGLSGYFKKGDLTECSVEEFNAAKNEIHKMLKGKNG